MRETMMKEQPTRPIEDVLAAYTAMLMDLPGVVGTGIGLCDDTPCIKVLVRTMDAATLERLPRSIEGHPVEAMETGDIRAF